MTSEQQRIAIAEACGWRRIPKPAKEIEELGFAHLRKEWWTVEFLPDYLNDLNVMHEVAMNLRISSPLKYIHYTAEITAIVAKHNSDLEDKYSISAHDASAPHRAMAFLKTIGKWVG